MYFPYSELSPFPHALSLPSLLSSLLSSAHTVISALPFCISVFYPCYSVECYPPPPAFAVQCLVITIPLFLLSSIAMQHATFGHCPKMDKRHGRDLAALVGSNFAPPKGLKHFLVFEEL